MPAVTSWGEYPHRVVSNRPVTPVIRELWLAPTGAALPYRCGQYALLSDTDHQVPERSFSIANAPRPDGQTSLPVTRLPGGTLTREPGARLDARIPELLPHCVGDLHGSEVSASGSTAFVTHCAAAAVALGADATAVHTEEFFTEPQPWTDRPPRSPRTSV